MSEPCDLPPDPIFPRHYGEEEDPPALSHPDESPDPQDEAQKAIDTMIAREARELVKHADARVRAAAVFQLAPHEVPFLLGDPEPVVRLAAVRVCASFPLLRVLLIDLKLGRRDPSAEVRAEAAALLDEEAAGVRTHLATWAIEALVASPLFDIEEPAEGLDHPRLRVLPSGSARERGASASWARYDLLDRPVEEVVPSPRLGDSCAGIKTVARVHDNRRGWTPAGSNIVVDHDEGYRVPPAPHGPAEGEWDGEDAQTPPRMGLEAFPSAAPGAIVAVTDQANGPPSRETEDGTDPIHAMTDKEPT